MLGIGCYPKFPFMHGPDAFLLHDPRYMRPTAGHFNRFDRFIDPGAAIGPF